MLKDTDFLVVFPQEAALKILQDFRFTSLLNELKAQIGFLWIVGTNVYDLMPYSS